MKNTKNTLIAGVALAIALFTSVQVVAMEPGRIVNKELNPSQKKTIRFKINNTNMRLEACDPKKVSQQTREVCNKLRQLLPKLEAVYYDDRPYTDDEIDAIINE